MLTYKILLQTLSSTVALLLLSLVILQTLGDFRHLLSAPTLIPPGPPGERYIPVNITYYPYKMYQMLLPFKVAVVDVRRPDLVDLVKFYVNERFYVNPEGTIDCNGPCFMLILVVRNATVVYEAPPPVTVVVVRAYTDHIKPLIAVLSIAIITLSVLLWVVRRGRRVYSLG
jgi:hypothetical protein